MELENIRHCRGYKNIVILSELCINSYNITSLECIQNNDDIKSNIRTLLGIWSTQIAICGTSLNLLTILAIPHAAKHKRYGLDQNYNTTTIFVLHQ